MGSCQPGEHPTLVCTSRGPLCHWAVVTSTHGPDLPARCDLLDRRRAARPRRRTGVLRRPARLGVRPGDAARRTRALRHRHPRRPRRRGPRGGGGRRAMEHLRRRRRRRCRRARATSLGATVVSAPADAGPGGRGATLLDPQGCEIRLWQAARRLGAQVANTPGAWNFSNLHTADPAAAQRFYGELFGWSFTDQGWADRDQRARLRRPPRSHDRPRHPHPAGRRTRGLRGRHRGDRAGRGRSLRAGRSCSPSPTATTRSPGSSASGGTVLHADRERLDARRRRPRPAGRRLHGQPVHPARQPGSEPSRLPGGAARRSARDDSTGAERVGGCCPRRRCPRGGRARRVGRVSTATVVDPTERARELLGVARLTNAALTGWLHGLPGVDQVGCEERAAGLGTRSIKTTSKAWAHRHGHLDDRPHHPRGRRHPGQGARPGRQGPASPTRATPPPRVRRPSASTATWWPSPRRPSAAAGSRSRPSPRPSRPAARACRSSSPTSADAVKAGADEIDMVIDRGAFLAGDYLTVFYADRRGQGDLRQRPPQGDHGDRRAGHLRQRAPCVVAVDARWRRLHQDLHRQGLSRPRPCR